MKCLTLNTHSWIEENSLDKLNDLVEHIYKEDYDVICLQEVNQSMSGKLIKPPRTYIQEPTAAELREDNFALVLTQLLGEQGRVYYWSWGYNHIGYDQYHEGVAILSKTPMAVKTHLVSDTDDEKDYHTRRVLIAETEIEGHRLTFVSVHLSWFGKGFEGEWERLENLLETATSPLILMGDFNNPSHQDGYNLIQKSILNLQDSHEVAKEIKGNYTIVADIDGWKGNKNQLKVDYVFTSKELNIRCSKIVLDGNNSPLVSDHFGIMVEILL